MELLVLGPIEARTDGRQITLGAAKQRAVLAMLSLRANSTVSADELMEGLWGERRSCRRGGECAPWRPYRQTHAAGATRALA
jgi:DNA-binding SARP family transcriptional activator